MATNLGKDIFFHRNTCMSESFLSNTSVYLLYLQLAKSKQCKTASGTVNLLPAFFLIIVLLQEMNENLCSKI